MRGKLVTVTADRPLGSVHPEYPDLRYPVNYGYMIEAVLLAALGGNRKTWHLLFPTF